MQLNFVCAIIPLMNKSVFNVPNILTFIRLLLVPVYWVAFFHLSIWVALSVFLVAFITDWLDGMIARRTNTITNLGKVLDPFADKCMQISAMISVVVIGKLHFVYAILIVAKELFMIVSGAFLYKKNVVVYSNVFGKLATVLTMIGFLITYVSIGVVGEASATLLTIGTIVISIALVSSYVAFVVYTVMTIRQLKGKKLDGTENIDIKF